MTLLGVGNGAQSRSHQTRRLRRWHVQCPAVGWRDAGFDDELCAAFRRAEELGCSLTDVSASGKPHIRVGYVGIDGRYTLVPFEHSRADSQAWHARTVQVFLDLVERSGNRPESEERE